ncbi:twin-arginine translocation signal domain-containing protein [Halorussus marinus]|uniref:twin-arginine translocation signal domain-containing protein n=1 Tax=Halorussus marinus TaxID=2505976 RepID=UPI00106DE51D|nr:twin-arginine translocation signal domain-containing protein [Halorussus marinus]
MQRRKFLKTTGSIGAAAAIGGSGILAMSGGAAASDISITASSPATVQNDRGDVSKVTTNPQFDVSWKNLDDAVAKVFFLIEANVGGQGFVPIYRATPWLPAGTENNSYLKAESGTTGQYTLKHPLVKVLNQDDRFDDGTPPNESASPLVIADEDGNPDYSGADWSNYGPASESSYMNGVSVGSASEAEAFLVNDEGLVLQNNYPDIDSGYYGAASDTSVLDHETDGKSDDTKVVLRYTFELQRPNKSWAASRTSLDSSASKEELAAELDGIQPSDIDGGNSKIVMNGEDGNTNFNNPDGIPYSNLQANADSHVGILSTTATFKVTAKNEGAESGVTGSSNTNAS